MNAGVSLDDRAECAEPPERGLIAVSLDDLAAAEHKPHSFAVWPIIPARVVTLLSAHGGVGKSNLALTIAAHYACGRDFAHYRIDEAGRALFVSFEDAGDLVRFRLRRIAAAYDLPIESLQRRMTIVDGSDGDGTMAVEYGANGTRELISTRMHDEVCDFARGHGLIVVDNASDAYGANENDRRQVRTFMRMLGSIARGNDAGMLLLAHVDKAVARSGATSDRYSGSTAWNNSARSRLELTVSDGVITLSHAKHNLSHAADPLRLLWTEGGVLIPAGAVADGIALARSDNGNADVDSLIVAMRAAENAAVIVPTGRTGPATAQRVLEALPEFPKRLRGSKGRDAFWSALSRLQADGVVETVEYTTQARHARTRFALVYAPLQSPTPPAAEPAKPAQPVRQSRGSRQFPRTGETGETGADGYRRTRDGEL